MKNIVQQRLRKLARSIPVSEGCHLVGGAVRDCLLGLSPLDLDIVSETDPLRTARAIAGKFKKRVIHLNQNNHHLFRVVTPQYVFDITAVNGPDIEADLTGRDFTINAMAFDLARGRLIDILGSRSDLSKKVIKMINPGVFKTDPLRLLRAYRMAACLDFSISPSTLAAISGQAQAICNVAGERVNAELFKILDLPCSAPILNSMGRSGLLGAIFPELKEMAACPPTAHHALDGFAHSLQAYRFMEKVLSCPEQWINGWYNLLPEAGHPDFAIIKLAALLHDIGKPACMQTGKDGQLKFNGHPQSGAALAAGLSARIRLSRSQQNLLEFLLLHHMRLFHLFRLADAGGPGPKALGRFFKIAGSRTPYLLALFAADTAAKHKEPGKKQKELSAFSQMLHTHWLKVAADKQPHKPLVTGRDLIEKFDLRPSPLFGSILGKLTEMQLAGIVTDRPQALLWVRKYLSNFQ